MRILFYNKEQKITEVLSIRSLFELTEEDKQWDYLYFDESTAVNGMDIRAVNEDSSVKPISEQVEMGLITLKDDEVLEGEVIRQLTEEEMKEKYPDRYPKDPKPTEPEQVTGEINAQLERNYNRNGTKASVDRNICPQNKDQISRTRAPRTLPQTIRKKNRIRKHFFKRLTLQISVTVSHI